MSYQSFPIFQFQSGLDTDIQPWMLPQDAFQEIVNGYIQHGVLNKRNGMQTFGWFVNSPDYTIVTISKVDVVIGVNQKAVVELNTVVGITAGTRFIIRTATGMTQINNTTYQVANISGNTFEVYDIYGEQVNVITWGAYIAGGIFYIVPEEPIMGIKSFLDNTNRKAQLIFNTKRAAFYDTSINAYSPIDSADIWNSDEKHFVSGSAFGRTGSFGTITYYFTNFNGDTNSSVYPMRQYVGNTPTTSIFAPNTRTVASPVYVVAAQFIFTMRQRLLLLNTVESSTYPSGTPPISVTSTNYPQRLRWSRANNPAFPDNPLSTDTTWNEITPGNGGFVDCPTSETIISATQLQDVIIVYFKDSVWAVEPTSDPALPFRWTKINSYRACDAPYGNIGHDRFVISYGQRGITGCDRVEVKRIDDKIQNFVTEEISQTLFSQCYSDRNYAQRRSWTLFPSANTNVNPAILPTTSNYALIRTEEEGSWSVYSAYSTDIDPVEGINMSCLGYGFTETDYTLGQFADGTLPDLPMGEITNTIGSYFSKSKSDLFLGGDQIGRVLTLETDSDDLGQPISFTMTSAGWNPFKDKGISAQFGYIDFYVDADMSIQFTVEFFASDINEPYAIQTLDCLPPLGFIADIQDVVLDGTNPVEIVAYSHGLRTGSQVYIYNLIGAVGLMGVPFIVTVIDTNSFSLDGTDSSDYEPYVNGGTVAENPFSNQKCWKRAYAGGHGYLHFIRITNNAIDQTLKINGMLPWFRPAGSRMIE